MLDVRAVGAEAAVGVGIRGGEIIVAKRARLAGGATVERRGGIGVAQGQHRTAPAQHGEQAQSHTPLSARPGAAC